MANRVTCQRKRFSLFPRFLALGVCVLAPLCGLTQTIAVESRPPMGWNSWDGFGTTITELQTLENAHWMKDHLAVFGWQYIVVDMEWFTTNPTAEGNGKNQKHVLDLSGRYQPAPNRFPSSADGAGFTHLASDVHALGLKFGIHILQGIPREAVAEDAPIANSPFHAKDAVDGDNHCSWNPDNFDVKHNDAGQAYYDSLMSLYASWGVDLIKVDCLGAPRFKGSELEMIHAAILKSGRKMLLSTSPGEPPIDSESALRKNADQWRISNDIWDIWKGTGEYPQGVADQFARTAYWNRTRQPGHWPDADMLPLGYLGPAPGWGKPRKSRLTEDEARTQVTLWCIFRSPLFVGGNLPQMDSATLALLTNPDVLKLDQDSTRNREVFKRWDAVVWAADASSGDGHYLAIFNLTPSKKRLRFTREDFDLDSLPSTMHDLWNAQDVKTGPDLEVEVAGHGVRLLEFAGKPTN